MIAEKYKDRYYLNGESVFRRWGIVIEEGGYSEMTKKSSRKDQYVYDWQDENGVERYVPDKLLLEARTLNFKFTFLANSLTEYLTNYKNFFEYITTTGYFKLYSSTLGIEIELLYNNVTSVDDKTEMYKSSGDVMVTHNIVFDNDSGVIRYGGSLGDFNNDFNNDFLIK